MASKRSPYACLVKFRHPNGMRDHADAWVSRVATKRPLSLSRDSQEASIRHTAALRCSKPVVNQNWSGDYWMAPHLLKMRASYTLPGLEDIVNPLLPCFNFFYIVGIFKKSGDECTL